MEELIILSNSFMCDPRQTDLKIAQLVGQWVLPDDHYLEAEGRFEPSGIPIESFIAVVCFAKEAPYSNDFGFYDLCS